MRLCSLVLVLSFSVAAQQPGTPAGGQRPAQRRAGGPMIAPIVETGFTSIFDGQSLKGWDGDPEFWRVENGAIVGETSTAKQPAENTFLIWRGGSPANFELRLEYKLTGFNSGIQVRSDERPEFRWGMKGYQADIDGEQRYTGQWYEERGRGFLAMRGQFTFIQPGGKPALVGSLGDGDQLKSFIKGDGWNDVHIIARDNTIINIVNGHVMAMLIDDDPAGRKMDGLIGIQVHRGPAMKMEVRNIRLKKL